MASGISFRSKMILLLGLSMLTSFLITYLVYRGLQSYYRQNAYYGDSLNAFRNIMRSIGDVNVFLIIFIPLSVLFFFLYTKPYATYFNRISSGIHRLAVGDFDTPVRISSQDEFQAIAEDINMASDKLRQAIARGDFAETSKDQLVLNLAHDLRTPLTSVTGYLNYMLQAENLSDDQIRHFTSIAYTKSQRLEKLIDELFEITRMNYGMLPVKREPINLGELLVQLGEELYPIFEKNGLTLRSEVIPDLNIQGDGELLARVFENLLSNAARYGADGKYIDVRGEWDGQEAVIRVDNYGDRIPEAELPHLFEMFFTGDRARVQREGGTGIGLYIVKNIVERHDGTVEAESGPVLTRFTVRLPKA
ncbi:Signal transduction histidine kinase [Cohnella sp. OV330]|uniref:sensor histidine kinase n=1 Tax=Cohnella sp. OV330 TaxID=1855288 RepID=UPI0008F0E109|nr:HAMP domain-containing sensor histidine kinase [Cohnella sp. OV330]SFB41473.1 Signal transduction histidine kinase [Cohnella sp. OV330]